MANKRMIASDIWRDDYICSLDYFKRLLWIGMIVTCADDQGRMQDRAGFIAGDVFPGEMLSFDQIDSALKDFESEGKIVRYTANKIRLIQIVNWWNYQTPQWVMPSKYDAPTGWLDRVRMHTKDNKVRTENWDKEGGYQAYLPPVPTHVPTTVPTSVGGTIDDGDGYGDGYGDGDDEVVPPSGGDNDIISLPVMCIEFSKLAQIKYPRHDEVIPWSNALDAMRASGVTEPIMRQAIAELTEKKYKITGPQSIVKACDVIMGERKRKDQANIRIPDSAGVFGEYVQR